MFKPTTAFIKATQIERDESDSQSLTKIIFFFYCLSNNKILILII